MPYRFFTCDVFTETRFGGNPLAVLPQAAGLTDQQMQQIALEFNFAETTFVFPPEAGHTRKVRIFTPKHEVPFAGHPNVGTAFVLASSGELGAVQGERTVTFEEKAGIVAVRIQGAQGKIRSCELAAPQALSFGKELPVKMVADALSLTPADIATSVHPPQLVSVGLPFLIAQLQDRAALERARAVLSGLEALQAQGIWPSVYMYARVSDGFDVRARMFAPLAGVPEDPATGSATCSLAGLLAHHDQRAAGGFSWRIAQGVEMGRPSVLLARAEKKDGQVTGAWVGGSCVMVTEGTLHLD